MRARISGGIVGWLIGVVPLIVVNILDYQGLFAFQDAVVAGLVALVGGVVLGGVAAGLLGERGGGILSATTSGAIAAVLYAVTLIGLVIGTGILDTASPLIALHPLRISMALLFLAAILLTIAIGVGALSDRRTSAAPRSPQPARHSVPLSHTPQTLYDARRPRLPDQSQSHPSAGTYEDYRAPRDAGYGASNSRPLPPDASDPRYATSRSRSAGSSGSRRNEPPPARDASWR